MMKWGCLIMAVACLPFGSGANLGFAREGGPEAKATTAPVQSEPVPTLQIIPDPVEPMNRAFNGFNNGLSTIVIDPITKVYRLILVKPVRQSIQKAGYNIAYPLRLINTLLQGKFKGAGVETERFAVNTTIGVLGFFDPATRWGIKTYDEDFGQTFAHYGAGWGGYLDLPLFGPTSGRDALGMPLDSVANPASWVFLDTFFMINDLSFLLPQLKWTDELVLDQYATMRDGWALERQRKVLDYDQDSSKSASTLTGNPLPTIQAIRFKPADPLFFQKLKEREVLLPATGRKMPYSFRLQKQPAPLVFVVQGAGTHRLASAALAMDELLWKHGFSVVSISNPMNWEFIEQASSVAVPGYTPVDAQDLDTLLGLVQQDLSRRYPGQIRGTALLGLSLGGQDALFVAALQRNHATGLHLDRIVSVNPPVDLRYAYQMVDEYYRAPLEWPAAERQARMQAALLKIVQLTKPDAKPETPIPCDATESRYLIGLYYRWILRDTIFSSQRKQNLGVVPLRFGSWRRQPTYDYLSRYSYADYDRLFVMPYFARRGISAEQARRNANLRSIEPVLKSDPQIRVFINQDDFLLSPGDIDWLKHCLGDRLTVFPAGGHLGNLYRPDIQDQIMKSLEDLKKS